MIATATPMYRVWHAKAVKAAARTRRRVLPSARKPSAWTRARVANRMNTGPDMAHDDNSAMGTDRATARHAHAARKRDSRRARRYCPTTSAVNPKTAALRGPATW